MNAKLLCVIALQFLLTLPCSAEDTIRPDKVEFEDPFDRSGEEAILAAIAKGNLAELKRLENVLNRLTISNLGLSAWNSPNADVIVFLREKGKIAASDLQIAAARGDKNEVIRLLKRVQDWHYPPNSEEAYKNGTDFGFLVFTSDTPLRLAIRAGHTEVVRALVSGGANVNERVVHVPPHNFSDEFPLSEAIQLGNAEMVQLLVAGGATLEDPPTRYTAKDGKVSLHEFSIKHSASPKAAVEKKLKDMFDAGLLVQERDPDANAMCPLVMAISNGRAKIVSILLKAGANPNVLIGGERLRQGVNSDVFNAGDRRPLHVAAIKGNPEIVRLLIEKGADVNARTSDGRSPLSYAIGLSHGDVADLLRAAGAR